MARIVKNMDFFVQMFYHVFMENKQKYFWNAELVAASDPLTLTVRAVGCGMFTGRWRSEYPFNRLIYIFEGSPAPSRIYSDEDVFWMQPGRWLLVPAGHSVHHEQNAGLRLVSIHFRLERAPGFDYLSGCPGLSMGDAPERRDDFAALQDDRAGLATAFHLQALVWSMLEPVVRHDEAHIVRHAERLARYRPLLDAFSKDPQRDFAVGDMARVMGMGKVSFIKHFTAENGEPPATFFRRLRAAAAARELLTTDDTVREIAARFNFSDEFYFSRFMKRMTGLSPRAYRRSFMRDR